MTSRYRFPARRAAPTAVIRRLSQFAHLSFADQELLAGLDDWRHDPAGAELLRRHGPAQPRALIAGWAAEVRWMRDGRRQILDFVLPGDVFCLNRHFGAPIPCAVVALTPVQTLDATPLLRAMADEVGHEALAAACHIGAMLDEYALADQAVRLGRMTAFERIAHLICELRARMLRAGLGHEDQYPFPLTQEMLADAVGLSVVHVNRVLQQMRRDQLIVLHAGRLTIRDPDALAQLAEYEAPPLPDTSSTAKPMK